MDKPGDKQRRQETGKTPLQARKTLSGLPVDPLYLPEDQAGTYEEKLGLPGKYPFTRGVYSTMYLERPWTMRQYSGFGTAEDTNARYKRLLDVRRHRDGQAVRQCLSDLRAACHEPEKPLMPYIVDAVRAYATIGEVTDTRGIDHSGRSS